MSSENKHLSAEALSKKTFEEHYSELRTRLFYSVIALSLAVSVCFAFGNEIYDFLALPLARALNFSEGRKLIFTGLTEGFMVRFKVSLYSGCALSLPFMVGQLYLFLAPGLYKKEKLILSLYIIASIALFILSALLVYYFVIPAAWQFFLSFENFGENSVMPIVLEARISEYLDLVLSLVLGFGIAFQMPIILTIMIAMDFLTTGSMIKLRRYAIVGIFILAAVLTPPDVLSQISLALPLLLLYEASVLIGKIIEKKKEVKFVKH